jgi:hypothetical protein
MCWGIGQKPYTLETFGSAKFVDKFEVIFGEGCFVSRKGNIHEEILMNLIHHANVMIICESNSRIWLLFANLLSISGWLETGEVLGIRCEIRESGEVLIRESQRAVVFMDKSFGVLEEAKSKTSLQKSEFRV